MVDIEQLKGAIVSAGYCNFGKAGEAIGIAPRTFYRKLKSGDFSIAEVDDMIEAFYIRHPEDVFPYGKDKK